MSQAEKYVFESELRKRLKPHKVTSVAVEEEQSLRRPTNGEVKIWVKVTGRNVTPHMHRHSCIDSTIREFDIESVSKYVGHSNVSTTVNQYLSRTLGQGQIMQHIHRIHGKQS